MFQRAVTLVICGIWLAISAFGQGTTSRVTGAISDPTGSPIAGAVVTLTNEGTNAAYKAASTDNGAYFFEAVASGLYTVSVEAQGFKKFASRNNRVEIGQPTTVNVRLELGTLTEVVEVTDSAELVQTSTSGNFGNVFNDRVIRDLPIVGARGRNPLSLVTRQPGVVSGPTTGGEIHVNGARDRAWNFTVDGVDSNESSAGGSNFSPVRTNPDMLQEFKVVTSNATAEYGRNSGGQVSMVTKSGTNDVHGTAFWLYRTPSLNANEWANNIDNIGKRQFVQNIPGGSIGGPAIKNKLFYYGNLQVLRARESQSTTRTVYTADARTGLWRYVKGGGRNQPAGVAGASVDAQGNVLPGINVGAYNIVANDPQRLGLDPRIKALTGLTPLPNNFTVGDGLNTAGYTFAALQLEKQYDATVRADYIVNGKNTVFGRMMWGRQDTTCDRANGGSEWFPGMGCVVNTKRDPKNLAINWRTSPSATTTNEFVFGINRFAFNFDVPNADVNAIQLDASQADSSLPALPETVAYGNLRRINTYQLVDNFSWFKGAHSFKFGTNLRLQSHTDTRGAIASYNATQAVNFSRTINLVDGATFALPADIQQNNDRATLESNINLMLGRVGANYRGFVADGDKFVAGLYNFKANYNEYDFYVQDTWKVRRNLTVDLGLRWEMKMSPTADGGRVRHPNQYVAANGAPTDTLKWVQGDLFRNSINNWGPSVGMAWDPFGTGKTSIRANYRIAYDRLNTFLLSSQVFQNLPGIVDGVEDQTFGQGGGRLRNLPVLNPPTRTPSDLAQPAPFATRAITVVDPDFKMPTTHQWGFGIQREVMRNTVLEVNYLGRRAYHLFGAYNANQAQIRTNGFLDAVKTVNAGGDSPLINQLMSAHPSRQSSETGSQAMRRIFATDLRNNNVGNIAGTLSRVSVSGKSLADASGVGKYFFLAYPQFASGMNVIDSNDFSTYHALQTQLQKRLANGLEFQLSYTFSKALDTRSFDPAFTVVGTGAAQSAGGTPFDIANRKLNYAFSDVDRRHVWQSYWVYELPFGRGKRFGGSTSGLAERVIGGWQVAGFFTYQAGRPFSVYTGFNQFNSVVQSFVNCTGCDRSTGAINRQSGDLVWYFTQDEIAKMTQPGMGELGNTGRNFFRGPGGWGIDASLLKRTRVTERTSLELRADVTNLTNTPVWDLPTTTRSSSLFGRIRTPISGGSRKIQLGAKFNF